MQSSARLELRTREQQVYDYLRRAITEGRWGPEESIVGSRVAEELGVSRITVGHALKRLDAEGFVRLVPHKEAVVASLDPDEIVEIYVMRMALEIEAVGRACPRVTAEDLRELRLLNERIGQVVPLGPSAVRRADLDLHGRVRDLAGMPRLSEALQRLVDQGEYYRSRLLDAHGVLQPEPRVHDELLDALERHDAAAAREFTREHLMRGVRSLLGAIGRDWRLAFPPSGDAAAAKLEGEPTIG